jgi:hypothetical protein
MATSNIIREHFEPWRCKDRIGSKLYEAGHPGVVLEDRLVEAGLAVNVFGEDGVKSLVTRQLVTPCGYDVGGEHHYGYIFDKTPEADERFGEILEEVEAPSIN